MLMACGIAGAGGIPQAAAAELPATTSVDVQSAQPKHLVKVRKKVAAPTVEVANVRDFGAVGDGTTDDTAAFQQAIAESTAMKIPVYVPMGTYKITDTLTLTKQVMTGDAHASYTSDYQTLPTIVPADPADWAIRLKDGGAISGLNFQHPTDQVTAKQFATTVVLDGIGTRVSNVKISFPWAGIESIGDNTGRAVIQDVFISAPARLGMRIDTGWDATRISNVEVWTPPNVYQGAFWKSGIGIQLGHLDAFHMNNTFVFGANVGVLLQGTDKGATWGTIDGLTTDFCNVGVLSADKTLVTLTNTTHFSHVHALAITGGESRINVSGGHFRSNGNAAVFVHGGYYVTISSSEMEGRAGPALLVDGGAKVTITGNDISANSAGARFYGNGVINFSNNTIVADTHAAAFQNNATNPFNRFDGNIIYP
jgi:hypothetical protein